MIVHQIHCTNEFKSFQYRFCFCSFQFKHRGDFDSDFESFPLIVLMFCDLRMPLKYFLRWNEWMNVQCSLFINFCSFYIELPTLRTANTHKLLRIVSEWKCKYTIWFWLHNYLENYFWNVINCTGKDRNIRSIESSICDVLL